ncbi:uncharacterized protein PGTG_05306 [Puccinia graminis f. sp. tritici CRL 75-36-700-3]|uniref:Uncharacterized protein n=1 Tax=Puccinia graminis f. sp. tritici (strain CRL 75-36-700-3 / race SCCL) TaxID=418459 RepID=E3K6Z2_PUCGT|nr:uncharacterized protein PGTG_05306 [Puccinia graminis f. sp. tritici CRL 75-36-700-3]EFP80081.1 hypothetical protein PGTG_05306 [Puccinia graminis f. sp. tritici CRL 75-36-700-3]
MSSAVTPSDSACHPSKACWSRYSSGRSCTGLSPPLPPPVCSKPCFCPLVPPPLLVAPPQYTLNLIPQSAVNPGVRQYPDFPAESFLEPCAFSLLFPAFPRLGKLDFLLMHRRLPQPVCSISSACFPRQPRAFRMNPTNRSKLWSRRALATTSPQRLKSCPQDPPSPTHLPLHTSTSCTLPGPGPLINSSPFAPTRTNPFPASCHFCLPKPRYLSNSNKPVLREIFPDKAEGVFNAIPADMVKAAIKDIQGQFKTILSASVFPPLLRRSTYAAFLSELRNLRRHHLQVMAVFNPCLADYPEGNGDDPAPGPSSS